MKSTVSTEMMIYRDKVEIEINIDGYVRYTIDTSYGEDADGSRGSSRITVQSIDEVTAYDCIGDEVDLTKEETDRAADNLTRKFLEG